MKTRRHDLDHATRRFGAVSFALIGGRAPELAGKVGLVHIRLAARCEHPAVMHKKTRELMLMISGRATGRIGRRVVALRPGTLVDIPPGTWHSFHAGRSQVEALSIFVPPMSETSADVFVRQPGKSTAK